MSLAFLYTPGLPLQQKIATKKNTKSQHHKKTSNLRTGVTYGNFRAQRGRFFGVCMFNI